MHRHVDAAATDLNLVVPLLALLEERSVSRAAERLHRSQPSVSAILSRLRHLFSDPLLVRVGNRYELSPLGLQLVPRCRVALEQLEAVFDPRQTFVASATTRRFRLVASDYATTLLGTAALKEFGVSAPSASISFEAIDSDVFSTAPESLRAVDGAILPRCILPGLPSIELFDDRWVCLTTKGHPVASAGLTLDDLARLPWVAPYDMPIAADAQIRAHGREPRVQVRVDGFLGVGRLIVDTDRVAMVPSRLVSALPEHEQLQVWDPPFECPPIVYSLVWHPSKNDDDEHRWFRERIASIGRELATATSEP